MNTRGSQWNRWEPHIHAPGTLLNNQFTSGDWDGYLKALETATPQIAALAITDYYTTTLYEEVLTYKAAGRLPGVSLIIPNKRVFGLFNMQGLTLMTLYLLGFGMAIFSAYILNKILKIKSHSYFVVEMPSYKIPMFKNVAINVIEKTKSFTFQYAALFALCIAARSNRQPDATRPGSAFEPIIQAFCHDGKPPCGNFT